MRQVAVIGAGAWGTALAEAARRAGRAVTLWAREPEVVRAIATTHENTLYLPGIPLDRDLQATGDLSAAVAGADLVLLVPPAQHLRATCRALAPHLAPALPLVICAKGFERGSGALMGEVVAAELPDHPWLVLSGPTFASEVAQGRPTALTLAADEPALGRRVAEALSSRTFRPYLSGDRIGVQVGGAFKNVVAIACGVAAGAGLGDNARAALLTRGLAEIARLGAALGARPETLMGLAGLGDLALTCGSAQSRNFSLGLEIGRGAEAASVLAGRAAVTEGVATAEAALTLAGRHGIPTPIADAVADLLAGRAGVGAVMERLLARPLRAE